LKKSFEPNEDLSVPISIKLSSDKKA